MILTLRLALLALLADGSTDGKDGFTIAIGQQAVAGVQSPACAIVSCADVDA